MSSDVRTIMAKTRAIMTETERDRIAGVEEVEEIKRYQAISRVRRRIEEELTEDVAVLEEHHPGLLEELREVVCENGAEVERTPPAPEPAEAPAADDVPGREPEKAEDGPEERLQAVDFPRGRDRDECVETVLEAREFLRREGSASMRDFVTEVMPEYPLGYDVPELEPGDRYRGAWWRKIVKPGLKALPDVKYRQGHGDYLYIGESDE